MCVCVCVCLYVCDVNECVCVRMLQINIHKHAYFPAVFVCVKRDYYGLYSHMRATLLIGKRKTYVSFEL